MGQVAERLASPAERRQDQRLPLHLSVECRLRFADDGERIVRTTTQNVSSGGIYLELDDCNLAAGDRFDVEMIIPASDGVAPYPGRATCQAQVVRCDRVPAGGTLKRFGIAAKFLDRLRISY